MKQSGRRLVTVGARVRHTLRLAVLSCGVAVFLSFASPGACLAQDAALRVNASGNVEITADSLTTTGAIRAGGAIRARAFVGLGAVPVGAILMWSGAENALPPGWALCNGENGTPDLRDRFIVGSGANYAVGSTGGANTVTLTPGNLPAYTVLNTTVAFANSGQNVLTQGLQSNVRIRNTGPAQPHSHPLEARLPPGGLQPLENRPPYYALAFIMYKGG
jgi:microcystin-dependent protein